VVRAFADRFHFQATSAEIHSLQESVRAWPPFPDTVPALRELQKRYKIVVISNIDDDLFAETQKRLDVEFDGVITAEQARSYNLPSIISDGPTHPALSPDRFAPRRAEHLSRCGAGAVVGDLDGVGKPGVGSPRDWRSPSLGGTSGYRGSRSCPLATAIMVQAQADTLAGNSVLTTAPNWENLLLYGNRDQLGLVVNFEFAHQVELVCFHRLGAYSQNLCRLLYGVASRATSSLRARAESGYFSAAATRADFLPWLASSFNFSLRPVDSMTVRRDAPLAARAIKPAREYLQQVTAGTRAQACCTYSRSSCMVRSRCACQCSVLR